MEHRAAINHVAEGCPNLRQRAAARVVLPTSDASTDTVLAHQYWPTAVRVVLFGARPYLSHDVVMTSPPDNSYV